MNHLTLFLGTMRRSITGILEKEVLKSLLTVLNEIGQQQKKKQLLIFKPHPRRGVPIDIAGLIGDVANYKYVEVAVLTVSGQWLASKAAIVLGMTSMLLFEASIMGRAVISLQPARKKQNSITDHRKGIIVIEQMDELQGKIAYLIQEKRCPDLGSSENIEKFMTGLLAVKGGFNAGSDKSFT